MGDVLRTLAHRELPALPALYAGMISVETAESLHYHEHNVRLLWDQAGFEALTDALAEARAAWEAAGRPALHDGPTTYLALRPDQPPPHGPPTLAIEENTYPTLPDTTVHLHYRHLRIEFTHQEWEQFADAVAEARETWNNSRG